MVTDRECVYRPVRVLRTRSVLFGGGGMLAHGRLHRGQQANLAFNASHSAVVKVPSASARRARRRCAKTLMLQSLQAEKNVLLERRVNPLFGRTRRQR